MKTFNDKDVLWFKIKRRFNDEEKRFKDQNETQIFFPLRKKNIIQCETKTQRQQENNKKKKVMLKIMQEREEGK